MRSAGVGRAAWGALLVLAGCAPSVTQMLAEGQRVPACHALTHSRQAEGMAAAQADLLAHLPVRVSFEPTTAEEVGAHFDLVPNEGKRFWKLRFETGAARAGQATILQSVVFGADERPRDGRDYEAFARADFPRVELPPPYVRPPYEPERPAPRLRYRTTRALNAAQQLQNAASDLFRVATLGLARAPRHHPVRELIPASARALERWREQNEAHHAAWEAQQAEREAQREADREAARARNVEIEAEEAAYQERWQRAWRQEQLSFGGCAVNGPDPGECVSYGAIEDAPAELQIGVRFILLGEPSACSYDAVFRVPVEGGIADRPLSDFDLIRLRPYASISRPTYGLERR